MRIEMYCYGKCRIAFSHVATHNGFAITMFEHKYIFVNDTICILIKIPL